MESMTYLYLCTKAAKPTKLWRFSARNCIVTNVRPRFVDGQFTRIRVTPNVFSTLEEVDLFVKGIEDAVRNGVSV